jgi:hypothetical protein
MKNLTTIHRRCPILRLSASFGAMLTLLFNSGMFKSPWNADEETRYHKKRSKML